MAVKKLRLFPDLILNRPCASVTIFGSNLNALIEDLKDTLFHSVKMKFTDEAGNINELKFFLRCTQFRVGQVLRHPPIVNSKMYLDLHLSVDLPVRLCPLHSLPDC